VSLHTAIEKEDGTGTDKKKHLETFLNASFAFQQKMIRSYSLQGRQGRISAFSLALPRKLTSFWSDECGMRTVMETVTIKDQVGQADLLSL